MGLLGRAVEVGDERRPGPEHGGEGARGASPDPTTKKRTWKRWDRTAGAGTRTQVGGGAAAVAPQVGAPSPGRVRHSKSDSLHVPRGFSVSSFFPGAHACSKETARPDCAPDARTRHHTHALSRSRTHAKATAIVTWTKRRVDATSSAVARPVAALAGSGVGVGVSESRTSSSTRPSVVAPSTHVLPSRRRLRPDSRRRSRHAARSLERRGRRARLPHSRRRGRLPGSATTAPVDRHVDGTHVSPLAHCGIDGGRTLAGPEVTSRWNSHWSSRPVGRVGPPWSDAAGRRAMAACVRVRACAFGS